MSKKKNKDGVRFKPWESRSPDGGGFTPFAFDMAKAEAFDGLTASQIGLYLMMRLQYHPDKYLKNGSINPDNHERIMFPNTKWKPLYLGNQRKWQKDRQVLIERGFIEYVGCGKKNRTPSFYKLSENWKSYKKPKD